MIDENATFVQFGYHSAELSHKSGKRVIAVCDICGVIRDVAFYQYRKLCHKCAHIQHYKDDPDAGDKNRLAQLKHYKEHPELLDRKRETMLRRNALIPDHGALIVSHHVAYDFGNPAALTVQISRSKHAKVHHPNGPRYPGHRYILTD